MEIRYTKQASKYLLKMQPKKAEALRKKIKRIARGDASGLNIKFFANEGVYRLRMGQFRAIYEIQDEKLILIVIKIGARGDIYK